MNKVEGGLITRREVKQRDPDKIVVSIITVVYNGEDTLIECIDSIVGQDYGIENIEYIIVDGGSSDNTIKIIQEYDKQQYIDYWVSEKDSGVYDAMNKGIRLSSGDIISFMNADDYYYADAVRLSVEALTEKKADYSFGNALCIDSKTGFSFVWEGNLNYIFFDSAFVHQTEFVRRKCFDEIGFFEDKKLQVWSDWDFNARLYKNGYKHVYLDSTIARYKLGGLSRTSDRTFERNLIRQDFYLRDIGLTNEDIDYLIDLTRFNVSGGIDNKLEDILNVVVQNGASGISLYFLKSLCQLLCKDKRRLEKDKRYLEEEKCRLENDQWYKFGRLTIYEKVIFLFYKTAKAAVNKIRC